MKKLLSGVRPCVIALLTLACGCVGIEKGYPDKRYFVLEVAPGGNSASAPGNGTLQVAAVRVSPRFEDKGFVYRTSDASYETDFYNQFLIPPAALLGEEVRKGLAQSQLFRYVINSSSQLEPTHVLEGAVNALYGDFRDPSAPKAVVEMEFFLSKESGSKAEIVAAKRYARSVPIGRRSPEVLVKGWNEALEAILAAFVADLKSTAL